MKNKIKKDIDFIQEILEKLKSKNNNTGDIDTAIIMLKDWKDELEELLN